MAHFMDFVKFMKFMDFIGNIWNCRSSFCTTTIFGVTRKGKKDGFYKFYELYENLYIWQLHIVIGDMMNGEIELVEWVELVGKEGFNFLAKESVGIWIGEIRG